MDIGNRFADIQVFGNSTGTVTRADVTSLSSGNFAVSGVVYGVPSEDLRTSWDRFITVITPEGTVLNRTILTSDAQGKPAITPIDQGGFVISSSTLENGESLVFFDSQGVFEKEILMPQEFLYNSSTGDNSSTNLLQIGNKLHVVFSHWSWDSDSADIAYAQLDLNTLSFSKTSQVSQGLEHSQWMPKLSQLSNDNLLVVFDSNYGDGSYRTIYARIISQNGTPITNQFQVNEEIVGNQKNPVPIALQDGTFIVLYDGSPSINFRRFSNDGTPIGEELVVDGTMYGGSLDAELLPDGRIFMVQSGNGYRHGLESGDDRAIIAHLMDETGAVLSAPVGVNQYYLNTQDYPEVEINDQGDALILWRSREQDAGYDSIYSRIIKFDSIDKFFSIDKTDLNAAPKGSVEITGTAAEDETLTAVTDTLADDDGLGELSYQWKADGVDIVGATSSTLTLVQSEVGKAITVAVSYTDDGGTAEAMISSATSAVTNVNDDPTGSVEITGTAAEDETLTAVTDTLADEDGLGELSYQWKADGQDISGATGETLKLSQDEVGKEIAVAVSYTDDGGTEETVTSPATAIVTNVNQDPKGSVEIKGTAAEGQTLTADTSTLADEDGLGELNYQWLRDGSEINEATAYNYILTQEDVGSQISVCVSYTDGGDMLESATSDAISIDYYKDDHANSAGWHFFTASKSSNTITGKNKSVFLGGKGSDVFLSGAGAEFQTFIGFAGADTYRLNDTSVIAIAEVSDGSENRLYASGIGFYSESTYSLTIDGGQHLYVEDIVSEQSFYLIDWKDGGFDSSVAVLADGEYSAGFIKEYLESRPNYLGDFTWGELIESGASLPNNIVELVTDTKAWAAAEATFDDVTAPTLTSIDINGSEFSEGDTIEGSITAFDASGIARVYMAYQIPSGDYYTAELMDLYGDGTFTASGLIDFTVPEGSYSAESIYIQDVSPNENYIDYRYDGSVYINGTLQDEKHTFDFTALDFEIIEKDFGEFSSAFDIALTSTSDNVATFEVYATEAADAGDPGLDDVQFVLSHNLVDMTIDEASIDLADGFGLGIPNYDASTGELGLAAIAIPPVTDLTTPILTFDATILNDETPFSIAIDEVLVDDTSQERVEEEFDFSLVEVESTVVGRGGQALSDVRVSYDFVTPSGQEKSIELPMQAASTVSQAMDRGSDLAVTADRSVDATSADAITANDALQALRLAVGLDKSDGTAEWHDYIAADINKDGQVSANDALNILKLAVGLDDADPADWVFVDSSADWSDIDRKNTNYDEGVSLENVVTDTSVDMTGILVGEVNGSYVI